MKEHPTLRRMACQFCRVSDWMSTTKWTLTGELGLRPFSIAPVDLGTLALIDYMTLEGGANCSTGSGIMNPSAQIVPTSTQVTTDPSARMVTEAQQVRVCAARAWADAALQNCRHHSMDDPKSRRIHQPKSRQKQHTTIHGGLNFLHVLEPILNCRAVTTTAWIARLPQVTTDLFPKMAANAPPRGAT